MDRKVPDNRSALTLRAVATVLRRNRHAAALGLSRSITSWEKFTRQLTESGIEAFLEWETIPLVDYLIRYAESGDVTWRNLFLGERLKQLHWAQDDLAAMVERRRQAFATDKAELLALLSSRVRSADLEVFAAELDAMSALVTDGVETHRAVKILFVGDCLFLDLYSFLTIPLLALGITLRPVYAASKNAIELRNALRGLKEQKFDLICYSPYSYEFSLLLSQTHYPKGMLHGRGALLNMAGDAHRQTLSTLRLLTGDFDCPVFVHNTANLRRHGGSLGSYAKTFVTWMARRRVATEVNTLLARSIAEHNLTAPRPLMTIDEQSLVQVHGELALSRKFYDSEPQHPTVMSLRLAEVYRNVVFAGTALLGCKVIVVDLDNTLWNGVIGEGAIEHLQDRQNILKDLRNKGVLLAIASKNDPENIHWQGGILNEQDFVASEIHWGHKSSSIRRIAEGLNLKLKDFVFVDDRPDERELVQLSIPDLRCLDATDEETWKMLAWWAAALPEQTGTDRTQMYHERRERQAHLDEIAEQSQDQELLASLGLRLALHHATPKDLARAAELINRTNQFNTCGSRVTTQQMEQWHHSGDHHILVASASDKFGSMGLISVMLVEETDDVLEIPIWVLSCRVFGFGIETAMLNHLRSLARHKERTAIRGFVVETPNNQPCREVYLSNGFAWNSAVWELNDIEPQANPAWLEISVPELPPNLSRV